MSVSVLYTNVSSQKLIPVDTTNVSWKITPSVGGNITHLYARLGSVEADLFLDLSVSVTGGQVQHAWKSVIFRRRADQSAALLTQRGMSVCRLPEPIFVAKGETVTISVDSSDVFPSWQFESTQEVPLTLVEDSSNEAVVLDAVPLPSDIKEKVEKQQGLAATNNWTWKSLDYSTALLIFVLILIVYMR